MPPRGKHLWYGPARGTSLWNMYFTRLFGFPAGLANSDEPSTLATDMVAIVTGDPTMTEPGFANASGEPQGKWRFLSYEQLAAIIDRAKQLDVTHFARLDTDDPDLSAFKRRGGKMLVWHGTHDEVIPVQGTMQYYDSVIEKMGGIEEVQSFYRLYIVPGNGHMSPNGTSNPSANPPVIGPGEMYAMLVDWVEKGIVPGPIEIHSPSDEPVQRSLLICLYPAKIRYSGGDPNKASSYICALESTSM